MDTIAFRQVYNACLEYNGKQLYPDVLRPQLGPMKSTLQTLSYFRALSMANPAADAAHQQNLHQWYALTCFVRCTKPSDGFYPFDDRCMIAKT